MSTSDGVKQYLAAANDIDGTPLAKRPRFHSKTREPICTGLKIIGTDGHPGVVECGGSVTFDITLSNCADLRRFTVGVALHNDRSQRILLVHSEYQSQRFFDGVDGDMTVRCTIPNLPLTPGGYAVELIVSDAMSVVERVERADRLNVIFADYLGTGLLPKAYQSQLVLPATWDEA
jgi:hypothetical protein